MTDPSPPPLIRDNPVYFGNPYLITAYPVPNSNQMYVHLRLNYRIEGAQWQSPTLINQQWNFILNGSGFPALPQEIGSEAELRNIAEMLAPYARSVHHISTLNNPGYMPTILRTDYTADGTLNSPSQDMLIFYNNEGYNTVWLRPSIDNFGDRGWEFARQGSDTVWEIFPTVNGQVASGDMRPFFTLRLTGELDSQTTDTSSAQEVTKTYNTPNVQTDHIDGQFDRMTVAADFQGTPDHQQLVQKAQSSIGQQLRMIAQAERIDLQDEVLYLPPAMNPAEILRRQSESRYAGTRSGTSASYAASPSRSDEAFYSSQTSIKQDSKPLLSRLGQIPTGGSSLPAALGISVPAITLGLAAIKWFQKQR
ncbi:MAG: hypothetical protein AB7G80_06780 [Dongiaceae bacterium]